MKTSASFRLKFYKEHYKDIIRLGIPIMLGQLGIIVVGFTDNIMVGHHSMDELAAASFVNNIFNLFFIFGIGFAYGLTPIISGLIAKNKKVEAGTFLKNSLLINSIVGLFMIAGNVIILQNLDLLGQPEELIPLIKPYYALQIISVVFVMLFNSFKQFSDGTGDTVTPMYIMLGTNIFNIASNYALIYGNWGMPEMGLTGAGISTLLTRIFMLAPFIVVFKYNRKYTDFRKGFKNSFNKACIGRLTRLGFPLGTQMGVETASFSLSVLMMGWISSVALAAHQIAGVVTMLGFMIYYGIAAAVTIRVSTYHEKRDTINVRRSSFAGLHLISVVVVFVCILLYVSRDFIGYLFTGNEDVAQMTALLIYPVVLYQAGDGLQILFANALRGIYDVKYLAYMAFVCHFGIALPIGYLCGFTLEWGALGIWAGFPVSLTTLGFLLYRRFNKLTKAV